MTTTIGHPFRDNEGIKVQLTQDVYAATYPYPHYVVKFSLEPTAAGKRSAQYRYWRDKLGDDWSTDLTDNPEALVEALQRSGLTGAEITQTLDDARTMRNTTPLPKARTTFAHTRGDGSFWKVYQ